MCAGFFFNCLLISVLSLEIRFSEKVRWDPINLFNPATFLCLSKPGHGFSMLHVVVFDVFSEVRDGCLFC